MKYVYELNSIPDSLNKYLGKSGKWYAYQSDKKKWDNKVGLTVLSVGRPEIPFEKSVVTLHYQFPSRIKHDPDNYSGKLILDPLVKHGVLKDDNFLNIKLILEASYKKGEARTIITVEEKN